MLSLDKILGCCQKSLRTIAIKCTTFIQNVRFILMFKRKKRFMQNNKESII